MLKLITWNVNSINVRVDRLKKLIERTDADVICLQELKCLDEKFPADDLKALGYHTACFGQKTYNGVAILSKEPIENVRKGFAHSDDSAARFISGKIGSLWVANAYVPNGQEVGSEKYSYKLDWLNSMRQHLDKFHRPDEPLVLVGDFNVAPNDKDVYDPDLWHEKILCSTPEREGLKLVMDFGLRDLFREKYPDAKEYSWWDYRNLSFQKNLGLRIDLVLGTAPVLKSTEKVWIDRNERKGERPSDHVPVVAEINLDFRKD